MPFASGHAPKEEGADSMAKGDPGVVRRVNGGYWIS